GHFQLELDFANLTYNGPNRDRGNVRSTSLEVAPMNLKVGLFNDLDFQLVCRPYRWERTEHRDTGAIERKSGFAGMTPRFKWNVVGNDGGFFALALLPFVSLPLTQDHLGSSSVEGGLGVPVAFDLSNWEAGLQTTINVNRDEIGKAHHLEF